MSENITTRKHAIKALDTTLDLMRISSKWYRPVDIQKFIDKLGITLTEYEMLIVLQKLLDDNHIEFKVEHNRYRITFEGLVFNGYEQTAIISAQNETRIIRNERLLVRGTWAAAIVAAFLLLWNIWIWFYPVHKDYPYWFWEKISVVKKK
jgi:hypothetical protein